MFKKQYYTLILFALLLSSCVSTPNSIVAGGVNRAQSNHADSIHNVVITKSTATGIFTLDNKSLDFDAKVTISNEDIHELNTYNIEQMEISNSLEKDIVCAYFGEARKPDHIDPVTGILAFGNRLSSDNCVFYGTVKNIFTMYQHGKDFYPFSDALYEDANQVQCGVQVEDAISICDSFIQDINYLDYKLYDIHGFGKNNHPQYYSLTYVKYVEGLPFITNSEYTKVKFYVDKDGVSYVKGGNFTVKDRQSVDTILSLEDAIHILCKSLENLNLSVDDGSYLSQFANEETKGLEIIPIREIALEYTRMLDDTGTLKMIPFWRFFLEGPNGSINRSIILGVNAITGEICLR